MMNHCLLRLFFLLSWFLLNSLLLKLGTSHVSLICPVTFQPSLSPHLTLTRLLPYLYSHLCGKSFDRSPLWEEPGRLCADWTPHPLQQITQSLRRFSHSFTFGHVINLIYEFMKLTRFHQSTLNKTRSWNFSFTDIFRLFILYFVEAPAWLRLQFITVFLRHLLKIHPIGQESGVFSPLVQPINHQSPPDPLHLPVLPAPACSCPCFSSPAWRRVVVRPVLVTDLTYSSL